MTESTRKIVMQSTHNGADDGVTVRTYVKGETYEVGHDLANAFIAEKWAVPADEKKPDPKKKDDVPPQK